MISSCEHFIFDIEGTIAPISYVYDIMFPYIRKNLHVYVEKHWQEEFLNKIISQVQIDNNSSQNFTPVSFVKFIENIMDQDLKQTGLKSLQGFMWEDGFTRGELKAELFKDVAPFFKKIKNQHKKIYIYSSGSVLAQKLFIKYSIEGDLSSYVENYFDTTTGPKTEAQSYTKILQSIAAKPEATVFFSDICKELDAAKKSGMLAYQLVRPGNKEKECPIADKSINSFELV